MKFDFGHWAIVIVGIVSAIGPLVVAQLTAGQVASVSAVLGPIVTILATVAALFKTSPAADLLYAARLKAIAHKAVGIGTSLVIVVLCSSCAWFKANSATLSADASALAKCEITYVLSDPSPTPAGAVGACAGLVLADAVALFSTLATQVDSSGAPTVLAQRVRVGMVNAAVKGIH